MPPDNIYMHQGGKTGNHSEHLGYVPAELQFLRVRPGLRMVDNNSDLKMETGKTTPLKDLANTGNCHRPGNTGADGNRPRYRAERGLGGDTLVVTITPNVWGVRPWT